MQLKRETEYALRIMICLAEQFGSIRADMTGIQMTEIIERTNIPKIVFGRIFTLLEERDLVRKAANTAGETTVFPGKKFWNQSLLSVALIIEGNMNIFFIFDQTFSVFLPYKDQFMRIQKEIEQVLSQMTMKEISKQTL